MTGLKVQVEATNRGTEIEERARRAAKRGREMRLQWQSYARMMTRNAKLNIKFTQGTPRTDGDTIYLRIPIELGDNTPHDLNLCGVRDEDTLLIKCHACAILEDVQITMYHEVSHISYESFLSMNDRDRVQALAEGVRMLAANKDDGSRAKKLEAKFNNSAPPYFIAAANMISPWLGQIVNAGEDGRVNRRMMESRPGTVLMFKAQTRSTFENGIERPDGTMSFWRDQPLNMQAVIAIYCLVTDVDYSTYLADEVVTRLDDDELVRLCDNLKTVRTAREVFIGSIPILERLRELGFCKDKNDVEDDPKPDQQDKSDDKEQQQGQSSDSSDGGESGDTDEDDASQSGGDQKSEGTGKSSKSTDSDETGDSDDESDEDGSGGSGDDEDDSDDSDGGQGDEDVDADLDEDGNRINPTVSGSDEELDYGTVEEADKGFQKFARHDEAGHADTGGDEHTPEGTAMRTAVMQEEHFDQPSRNVNGVREHTEIEDGGAAWSSRYYYGESDPIKVPETILAPALNKLRIVFTANKRNEYTRDLKSGRVSGKVLGRRVPVNDPRLFQKKRKPGKRDYFVLIGLDVSGSTGNGTVINLIKTAAYAKAELCNRLGVKFAVYAHEGDYDHSGGTYGMLMDVYVIKSPEEPWTDKTRDRLNKLHCAGGNLDGHTLEYYRKVTEKQSATDKIILYYTDGAMPNANYEEELEILQREIKVCEKQNINIVGVGIRNDDPSNHGLDTIRLDEIEDVPKIVTELEKRLAK